MKLAARKLQEEKAQCKGEGQGDGGVENGEMGNGVFEVHVVCQENEFHLTAIMWQPFS